MTVRRYSGAGGELTISNRGPEGVIMMAGIFESDIVDSLATTIWKPR